MFICEDSIIKSWSHSLSNSTISVWGFKIECVVNRRVQRSVTVTQTSFFISLSSVLVSVCRERMNWETALMKCHAGQCILCNFTAAFHEWKVLYKLYYCLFQTCKKYLNNTRGKKTHSFDKGVTNQTCANCDNMVQVDIALFKRDHKHKKGWRPLK